MISKYFSLRYDEVHHLLRGRWLSEGDEESLYSAYEQLLAAAKAHDNCRYWLLDMSQQQWQTLNFTDWYRDFLANEVVREIGSPVFVAYVADESHRQAIETVATQALLKQMAQVEFYPYFFTQIAAAQDWLLEYQAHPDWQPPPASGRVGRLASAGQRGLSSLAYGQRTSRPALSSLALRSLLRQPAIGG